MIMVTIKTETINSASVKASRVRLAVAIANGRLLIG
jgi:hypothetical protein